MNFKKTLLFLFFVLTLSVKIGHATEPTVTKDDSENQKVAQTNNILSLNDSAAGVFRFYHWYYIEDERNPLDKTIDYKELEKLLKSHFKPDDLVVIALTNYPYPHQQIDKRDVLMWAKNITYPHIIIEDTYSENTHGATIIFLDNKNSYIPSKTNYK